MESTKTKLNEYHSSGITEYGSGTRRFLAMIVDMVILGAVSSPIHSKLNDSGLEGIELYAIKAVLGLMVYAYSIIGHGLWGQTIGKKIFGLKVIDKSESKTIGFKQALQRDIVPIIAWIPFFIGGAFRGVIDLGILQDNMFFLNISSIFGLVWPISEIVTMMTNQQRRAIHDLIAGTVVVRV